MAFVKGDIKLVASVTFYTNDPNLSENYNKYTEQQKEIFNKFLRQQFMLQISF